MCPTCLLNADTMVSPPPKAKDLQRQSSAETASEPPREGVEASENIPQFAVPIERLRDLFPDLEIEKMIGLGGMGAVYRARQPRLDRTVALKVLTCPPEMHEGFALRFEREAQVLARLNHPNIVTIFDFGEIDRSDDDGSHGNLFYFLMEFVDGADLNQMIRTGELKPEQALKIVPQICDALQFAHDEGVTHRDIKPANILIDLKGQVHIADFGLAKLIGTESDALGTGLTLTGTSMGTPFYMAPEQWESNAEVDHRADIYSLGVVIYEMLTGIRPQGAFSPPSKTVQVDVRIDEVVMKAMESNVELRYQQATEIKDDVTRATSTLEKSPPGKRLPLVIASTLAVVGLSSSALFHWREQNPGKADLSAPAKPPTSQLNSSSTDKAKPGPLVALGTMGFNGNPIDLSRAEGIDDFVQVVLHETGWIALRATGDTISSDGRGEMSGIAKICRGHYDGFSLIGSDHKLHVFSDILPGDSSNNSVENVPAEVQAIGVTDSVVGTWGVIALLRDKTVRVWGPQFDETPGTTFKKERWSKSATEELTNVVSIGLTQAYAAAVTSDGVLKAWNESPEIETPQIKAAQGQFKKALSSSGLQSLIWKGENRILVISPSGNTSETNLNYSVRDFTFSDTYTLFQTDDGNWFQPVTSDIPSEFLNQLPGRSPSSFSFHYKRAGDADGSDTGGLIAIGTLKKPTKIDVKDSETSVAGYLKAYGTLGDESAIDLSKAEGLTDFTQVLLQHLGWIGLRKNGETISSNGKGDRQNIRKLFPIGGNSFALLSEEDKLEFVGASPNPSPIFLSQHLPPELSEIGILDLAGDDRQCIALLKDGTARVWGPLYDNLELTPEWMGVKKAWQRPPQEALTNVQSIATGGGWASSINNDGKLWVWDADGPIDLRELESEQGNFEKVYPNVSKSVIARMKDGRFMVMYLLSNTHYFSTSMTTRESTDMTWARFISIWKSRKGEWINVGDPIPNLDNLFTLINGRSPDSFSMAIYNKGRKNALPLTHAGLITINHREIKEN
ncbi:serine/threonine-protein kinase [Verrucomicrobiales bacterium BCK34]|nr:serine/threonine-protein kinase [Verrucomicrobiales bacterium BCK34]